MPTETLIEPSKVRDSASCRAWLDRVCAARSGRLGPIEQLFRDLDAMVASPDQQLEIAEQVRPVHLSELAAMLDRIDASVFPVSELERAGLVSALAGLRLGRDSYRRIHDRFQEDSLVGRRIQAVTRGARRNASGPVTLAAMDSGVGASTVTGDSASLPPATPASGSRAAGGRPAAPLVPPLRTMLPLVRALDYHARLLATLMRLRMVVDPAEWEMLCVMGESLRASTFLDTSLPDPAPLIGRGANARALFVYPLLLMLARPWGRNATEFTLAARLARRWAGRVGFRLDEGAGHDLRHGPAVRLTEHRTVRLVTRRLRRRLDERLREVQNLGPKEVSRLPRGMTQAGTVALLAHLQRCWCDPRMVERTPDAHLGRMQLRFGLPSQREDDVSARARRPALHAAASRAYVYGRFEHNTIIREALGGASRNDPLAAWAERAQLADWVSIERQQAVFEIADFTPGLELGGLALVVAPRPEPAPGMVNRGAADAARGRMFGRVVSLAQRLPDDPRERVVRRIGLNVWSGAPQLVGVRIGDLHGFQDAFVLSPDPATGEPECLVLAPGSFTAPGLAILRQAVTDQRIRLHALLDRGTQFERVRFERLDG